MTLSRRLRLAVVWAACLWAIALGAAPADEPAARGGKAPKAPHPAFVAVTEVAGLPRVLLLGDSISIGYTLPVRRRLEGVANVCRPLENCGDTARGIERIERWLGEGRWAVIHFNFGLHDLKFLDAKGTYVDPAKGKQVATPAQYADQLRTLVTRLKRTEAQVIFATTTPVPPGSLGRIAGGEAVYNAAATAIMAEEGIPVNDLHRLMAEDRPVWQRPANVHYTDAGYDRMAEAVTTSMLSALRAAKPNL
jgi:acyl-CoA thioesterase-1